MKTKRSTGSRVNAFTIDVEDYFQVGAFENVISPSEWDHWPCRVEQNVDQFLRLLDHRGVRATFFTLGWIAERYPTVIRKIALQGHELASHGYGHQRVFSLTREAFRQDILRAKGLLEDLSGTPIKGYRAPSFSIDQRTPWAHETLLEAGHAYSSSVYPIQHDHYGMPNAPQVPWTTDSGLIEIPASTTKLFFKNRPASGGGFFRLLPYSVSKALIRRVNDRDERPVVFYCHPWEIDHEQPVVARATLKSKLRHYVNLSANFGKLDKLLGDFRWGRMLDAYPFIGHPEHSSPCESAASSKLL